MLGSQSGEKFQILLKTVFVVLTQFSLKFPKYNFTLKKFQPATKGIYSHLCVCVVGENMNNLHYEQ